MIKEAAIDVRKRDPAIIIRPCDFFSIGVIMGGRYLCSADAALALPQSSEGMRKK
jgi:hypothetical protein